jgi:hypothetical protein
MGSENSRNQCLSHHLERRTGHQVLDLLAHQNLRQFVMRYVLGRHAKFLQIFNLSTEAAKLLI